MTVDSVAATAAIIGLGHAVLIAIIKSSDPLADRISAAIAGVDVEVDPAGV